MDALAGVASVPAAAAGAPWATAPPVPRTPSAGPDGFVHRGVRHIPH
ncbi:hypothetical protein K7B10_23495 [Streptomyces flavotricini]|uniref:Uncharacterized protein n=1 Tax=Streptomyces flavotricini TaxID=66888 RepID=A0ABS8E9P3_9ACTN|nr:hypothetical protein [Streptomyces flavotricini]MCC0097688.1 hypothetical protein [Streptomyces flavotricini]